MPVLSIEHEIAMYVWGLAKKQNIPTRKLVNEWLKERLRTQDHIETDEKHQRDIQMAENNDELNKTIQIFLREVGKNIEPRPFRKESFNRNDRLLTRS